MDRTESKVCLNVNSHLENDNPLESEVNCGSEKVNSGLIFVSNEVSETSNCDVHPEKSSNLDQSSEESSQKEGTSPEMGPQIEAILGCCQFQGQLIFQVRVKNEPLLKAVMSSYVNENYPQKAIEYYESRIVRKRHLPSSNTKLDEQTENGLSEPHSLVMTAHSDSRNRFAMRDMSPQLKIHEVDSVCNTRDASEYHFELTCEADCEQQESSLKLIDPIILDLMEQVTSKVGEECTEADRIWSSALTESGQTMQMAHVVSLAELERKNLEELQNMTQTNKASHCDEICSNSSREFDELSETNLSFCSEESNIGGSDDPSEPMDTTDPQFSIQSELGNYMFTCNKQTDLYISETHVAKQLNHTESDRVVDYMKRSSRHESDYIDETEAEPEIERILSCCRHEGQLLFLVKLKGQSLHIAVPASYANYACPQKVIKYYQSRMGWSP